mgnify:CR=1 FL=1
MKNFIFITFILAFTYGLDYSLEDVNTTSSTYQEIVGPSYFQTDDFSDDNKLVSINYFGWETWNSWRPLFAQLCDLNNQGVWDTTKVVLIGIGIGAGGDSGLNGMINQDGANAPWVQDGSQEVWDEFLGENAPRRQLVLLDDNLDKRFQEQYSGTLNTQQKNELLNAIQELIDEASLILGDLNGDQNLNVLDIIILVDMSLVGTEVDLNGDINQDGGINVLDIVLLVSLILSS